MRKNLKRKARSCPLCKGNKTGQWSRWTDRERDRIRRAEAECREAVKR